MSGPIGETAQYMIDKGLMPWEEEEIHETLREIGEKYDDDAELTLRGAMEGLLEGDKWVRACDHAREMAHESAGALYDGGWRASDRDELARDYKLTPMEHDALIKALEDIEEETEGMWNDDDLETIADDIVHACTDNGRPRWDRMDNELEAHRVEDGLTAKQLKTVRKMAEKDLKEMDE